MKPKTKAEIKKDLEEQKKLLAEAEKELATQEVMIKNKRNKRGLIGV